MRITEIIIEAELEEGPIWDKVKSAGTAVGKGLGAVGQGIGAVASVPQGISQAIKKGYSAGVNTIGNGMNSSSTQKVATMPQSDNTSSQSSGNTTSSAKQQSSVRAKAQKISTQGTPKNITAQLVAQQKQIQAMQKQLDGLNKMLAAKPTPPSTPAKPTPPSTPAKPTPPTPPSTPAKPTPPTPPSTPAKPTQAELDADHERLASGTQESRNRRQKPVLDFRSNFLGQAI